MIELQRDCKGCVLRDTPLKDKVLNRCGEADPNYRVDYRLNGYGRTMCYIRRKRRSMMRKIVQIEVETEMTNKQLMVKELWKALGIKIIQIKVNAIKEEK